MSEKKKIQKVKKSNVVPNDIARLYELDVLERLKDKVKKGKIKNEKNSKELKRIYGDISVIRFS